MPQSLTTIYIHLVFSTKKRENTLQTSIFSEMRPYFITILNDMGCYLEELGGTENHIHLLFRLGKNHSISEIVQKLKSHSSHWLKNKDSFYHNFQWQEGYGAFSVSSNVIENVRHYIQNQEIHHAKLTFEDELRKILEQSNTEFDERYVWD